MIKRLLAIFVALSLLLPNIALSDPLAGMSASYREMFSKYITPDYVRSVYVDKSLTVDNWCRFDTWVNPKTGKVCRDGVDRPMYQFVVPQVVFGSVGGSNASASPMRYKTAKDKLGELARVVSMATEGPSDHFVSVTKASAQAQRARALLLGLASRNRLVGEGELQDLANCSIKGIREVAQKIIDDDNLAKLAETIWSVYSASRIERSTRDTRRAPTMSDVRMAVAQVAGTSWSDVLMYADDRKKHPECGTALTVAVVIARDILHK